MLLLQMDMLCLHHCIFFADIENLWFSDARKVDDPARLTPSLQSLGNPGTSYMEQRDFPSSQEKGKANSYSGNIQTMLQLQG